MITFEIKSGRLISLEYSRYLYHRRGRKAYRCWYSNGQKQSEWYYINGICQSSKHWNEQGEPIKRLGKMKSGNLIRMKE